jgi:Rab3 GTPase-activating protein catalytic subunit
MYSHLTSAHVENFMDMTIDPVLSPQWNVILFTRFDEKLMNLARTFKRAIRDWAVLENFNPFLDPSGNEASMPGAFTSEHSSNMSALSREAGIVNFFVDGNDLKEAVVSLFSTANIVPPVVFKKSAIPSVPFCTAQQLISLLRYKGATVPYESIMWKFCVRLLDSCGTKPSLLRFNAGMIPLLKGLWGELLSELRIQRDMGLYINGVDVLVYDDDKKEYTNNVEIDLHHILVHQKLAMMNCCLYRSSGLIPTSENRDKMLANARRQQRPKSVHQKESIQLRMFDTLSGIADMAIAQSDILSTVLPRGASGRSIPQSSRFTSGSSKSYGSPTSYHPGPGTSLSKVSMPGTSWSSDKSWERFAPPVGARSDDSIKINSTRRNSFSRHKNEPDEMFFDASDWDQQPTPLLEDQPKVEQLRSPLIPPSEMMESFIQITELSLQPTPSETGQVSATSLQRAGHAKEIPGMFLIATGEQAWEPCTQRCGFMTEDMIREQESLFTSLGTSSEGTAIRAKMQSAQLKSGTHW